MKTKDRLVTETDIETEMKKPEPTIGQNSIRIYDPEKYHIITTKECMEWLNISRTTLWNLRRNQIIPFIRCGNKILYSRSQVLESLTKINYTK